MKGEWLDEARRKRLELRAMLTGKDLVIMPGGFSPVYARMAQDIGFRCFFLAGSQLSGFLLGVPDGGILGLRDVVDHAVTAWRVCCREAKSCKRLANTKLKIAFVSSLQPKNASR